MSNYKPNTMEKSKPGYYFQGMTLHFEGFKLIATMHKGKGKTEYYINLRLISDVVLFDMKLYYKSLASMENHQFMLNSLDCASLVAFIQNLSNRLPF